jgi:hypothetical protein
MKKGLRLTHVVAECLSGKVLTIDLMKKGLRRDSTNSLRDSVLTIDLMKKGLRPA